jgi:hypothetical protein
MIQTQAPATPKQLWFLHCLTKQNTKDWQITMKEASDLITIAKANKLQGINAIIEAPTSTKRLSQPADPIISISGVTDIATVPVMVQGITLQQSHYLSMAPAVKGLPDKDLPGYGVTNMVYVKRNFLFVYIDTTWRDWSINYANKLRNPDYQREIESQGYKQIADVTMN